MIERLAGPADRQRPFDAAVVMPTLLRPSLTRAVASVFAQDLPGRIQLLIGIDRAEGERAQLAALAQSCPSHIAFDVLDLGYSTSIAHGGLYPNRCSGSLRTILSYAANSRYVAYLDDDNWWAPDHLSSLAAAIGEREWSWSLRWFVEPDAPAEPIAIDRWESVGPGAGLYAERYSGFVDPSSLMLDKLACHHILPLWSLAAYPDGRGEDRLIFAELKDRPQRGTGQATSFYRMSERDPQHLTRLRLMRQLRVVLPSDRRRGVVALVDLVGPGVAAGPEAAALPPADPVLGPLLALLRPAECVVLGQDAAVQALAASAGGLDCLIVAVSAAAPAIAGAAVRWLPEAALRRAPLAVDLVLIGPDGQGPAAWDEGFALLRPGGVLIGCDRPGPALADFVSRTGSTALPLAQAGSCVGWVVEKGVGVGG
jgi:hypothetical protein